MNTLQETQTLGAMHNRWEGITRGYTEQDVQKLRGTVDIK